MSKISAGILLFRRRGSALEFFLVHPGGPFFSGKDDGVWGIPKGELARGEDAFEAAKREFEEETGFRAEGTFLPLTAVQQKSGKTVLAWAVEGACDPAKLLSNTFTMEWPPRSGRQQEFPEVDRAAWFGYEEARKKINPAQAAFLEELRKVLRSV